jgi:hypothetical protein
MGGSACCEIILRFEHGRVSVQLFCKESVIIMNELHITHYDIIPPEKPEMHPHDALVPIKEQKKSHLQMILAGL